MASSNGSANGTAHSPASSPFPVNDQSTSWSAPRNRRPNPIDLINSGGLGHTPPPQAGTMSSQAPGAAQAAERDFSYSIPQALDLYDKQYLPTGSKSLSGIALRSLLLGVSLALSLLTTIYLLLPQTSTPLWRAPFFLSILSVFHFLEFWTTAAYNTRAAGISSFLLSSNGVAYQGAHLFAISEFILTHHFFPDRKWLPAALQGPLLYAGLFLIFTCQIIRSLAMCSAGQSFNHVVQFTRQPSHILVTSGIYAWLRHPSYFGFFWWAIGTQLVLGNLAGFVVYAGVLLRFFRRRIEGEEELLVKFFGDEYVQYRERTKVGIPFIR